MKGKKREGCGNVLGVETVKSFGFGLAHLAFIKVVTNVKLLDEFCGEFQKKKTKTEKRGKWRRRSR